MGIPHPEEGRTFEGNRVDGELRFFCRWTSENPAPKRWCFEGEANCILTLKIRASARRGIYEDKRKMLNHNELRCDATS
jgi:hypothetical protein